MLRNLLVLCMLLTFVLAGCFTAVDQGNTPQNQNQGNNPAPAQPAPGQPNLEQENARLRRTITTQNQRIQALQREVANLRAAQPQVDSDIEVQRLRVISEEAYTEGDRAGAVYGRFDIQASIRNTSNTTRNNVKVIATFQRTQRGYPRAKPNTQVVVYTIPTLRAGQTAMITFRGFRVDNPELIQEVIVHPAGYNDVSKVRVRAAFPPNNQD